MLRRFNISRSSLFKMSQSPACLSGVSSNLLASQIVEYETVKSLKNHPEKLLVDVREPDEVAGGKIPTSINIPIKTLEETLNLSSEEFRSKFNREKPSQDAEIIFHCKGGGRGGRATELALTLGYSNAKSYKGSWLDWCKREGLDQ